MYGMEIIETPTVSYDDIGGLDGQIQELRETVELPLLKPELFQRVGIEPPKGVLLYGPPGTGKTLLAKAVAKETESVFIRIVGSELFKSTSAKALDSFESYLKWPGTRLPAFFSLTNSML